MGHPNGSTTLPSGCIPSIRGHKFFLPPWPTRVFLNGLEYQLFFVLRYQVWNIAKPSSSWYACLPPNLKSYYARWSLWMKPIIRIFTYKVSQKKWWPWVRRGIFVIAIFHIFISNPRLTHNSITRTNKVSRWFCCNHFNEIR